jgi:hypothetical protein
MEKKDYTKLSVLVGSSFTVEHVHGYKFKKWNNEEKKMEVSDKWQEGYRKVYEVDTSKGKLDLSAGQMGQILEAVVQNGLADINLRTIEVKSNGKTGMDIRYYFDAVPEARPLPDKELNNEEPDWENEEIPF